MTNFQYPPQMSMRTEEDMLDDLERAKQYKANIMQVGLPLRASYVIGNVSLREKPFFL